jgi:hypothetical protein
MSYLRKQASIVLILLAATFASGSASATQVALQNLGNLTFYYTNAGVPIVRQDAPGPVGTTIFHPGNPYGTDSLGFGVANAAQPPGVTTHAMSFDFYSENYFSKNPAGHIFFLLKGRTSADNPATPANEAELSGRGIALGNTSGRQPDGCPVPALGRGIAQVESFYNVLPGNTLFPATCSSQIKDNYWYKFVIHANNNRWVAYYITDFSGNVIYANYAMQDPGSFISETLGGWGISPVFNTKANQNLSWKIWLQNVKVWWF